MGLGGVDGGSEREGVHRRREELVCVCWGVGVRFMAWVEVFTARTQGGHQAVLQD